MDQRHIRMPIAQLLNQLIDATSLGGKILKPGLYGKRLQDRGDLGKVHRRPGIKPGPLAYLTSSGADYALVQAWAGVQQEYIHGPLKRRIAAERLKVSNFTTYYG